jgi:hypothetical protein
LVLEQQPAKRDGDQGRNEKRQPDPSLVVASDGSKLGAGQVIVGLRHHIPPYRAESCRRPTMQTLTNQPDNFITSMTVAFIMDAAMAAA